MNYYWHTNICECCKRTDMLHVGKLAKGWTFLFRAYQEGDVHITSISDWEKYFKRTPGILVDERERVVEHPLQFLADLERPTPDVQEDEDAPDRRGAWAKPFNPSTEWRDADGFRFVLGEFT